MPDAQSSFLFKESPLVGPFTRARQQRTLAIYGAICVVGALPALLGASTGWQAAGLGLWLPGAGFMASAGWAWLLFPLTLLLFALSILAWFYVAALAAPIAVYFGAAALAGGMVGDTAIWSGAHPTAAALIAVTAIVSRWFIRDRYRKGAEKATARAEFLPRSLAEVGERVVATPNPAARELDADDLPSLRYALDRALQPIDEWGGFDIQDQFQTAALRYQLNGLGYALGIVQGAYTPNFRGYMREAQRNLIEKYLQRRVWDYWIYESCWGAFNFTNFDPAARDNIMLTGWFGAQVGQYMINTGDRHFAEESNLSFRLSEKTVYRHDFHTIIGSVVDNYRLDEGQFCLYPCEPHWIYTICNHYGMTALATHDRLFGTDFVDRFLPIWLDKLDEEFTVESGSMIGIRNQLTGLAIPITVPESPFACLANTFAPELAKRHWALARKDVENSLSTDEDGELRVNLPGRGMDPGNHGPGHQAMYAAILSGAREFGDEEIARAAQHSLDSDCGLQIDNGVRRYMSASNQANADAFRGRITRIGDFRRSFVEGPNDATLRGPMLTDAPYPDVLVARAYSDGEDLDLTVYPGAASSSRQTLTVDQLQPGKEYHVVGAEAPTLTSDGQGRARFDVNISGRTAIRIEPS